ncbi:MAG: hypothetical protein NEHIOOID_00246 [Holosporales bacterium]
MKITKKTFIYALIALVVVLIGYLKHEKILMLSVFNSKIVSLENDDYEIVIARYKEDLSWIKDYFPIEKVTVYNKGGDVLDLGKNVKVVPVENVGREAQTYVFHIVKNYKNLRGNIVFLQGNPFDHGGKRFLDNIKNKKVFYSYYSKNIIGSNENVYDMFKVFKESEKSLTPEALKNTSWKNTTFSENYKTLTDFLKYHDIFIKDMSRKIIVSYGAQFMVAREKILSRSIEFYKKLLSTLSSANAPIEGHYLERTWELVFDGNLSESVVLEN